MLKSWLNPHEMVPMSLANFKHFAPLLPPRERCHTKGIAQCTDAALLQAFHRALLSRHAHLAWGIYTSKKIGHWSTLVNGFQNLLQTSGKCMFIYPKIGFTWFYGKLSGPPVDSSLIFRQKLGTKCIGCSSTQRWPHRLQNMNLALRDGHGEKGSIHCQWFSRSRCSVSL